MKFRKLWKDIKSGARSIANSDVVRDLKNVAMEHAVGAIGGAARRRKKGRFRKGSRAAKAWMAKIRELRH